MFLTFFNSMLAKTGLTPLKSDFHSNHRPLEDENRRSTGFIGSHHQAAQEAKQEDAQGRWGTSLDLPESKKMDQRAMNIWMTLDECFAIVYSKIYPKKTLNPVMEDPQRVFRKSDITKIMDNSWCGAWLGADSCKLAPMMHTVRLNLPFRP